eukprot:65973-Rhodomonas_salina.2
MAERLLAEGARARGETEWAAAGVVAESSSLSGTEETGEASVAEGETPAREKAGGHLSAKQKLDWAKVSQLAKKGQVKGPVEHSALAYIQAVAVMHCSIDRHCQGTPPPSQAEPETQLMEPRGEDTSPTNID